MPSKAAEPWEIVGILAIAFASAIDHTWVAAHLSLSMYDHVGFNDRYGPDSERCSARAKAVEARDPIQTSIRISWEISESHTAPAAAPAGRVLIGDPQSVLF
jgi:hypothetical protein